MEPIDKKNLQKFIFGADHADKLELFDRGLEQIEIKYPTFFNERKARLFPDEQDKLGFHYIMTFDRYNIVFGFLESSDLPHDIKQECVELFNTIFK